MSKLTVVLDKKVVNVDQKIVPISELSFDLDNPRLRSAFEVSGLPKTQEAISSLLLAKPAVQDLLASIRENGGLTDPLWVQEQSSGQYRVLEGNCRLSCLQSLATSCPVFSTAPCLVVAESFTREERAVLLGRIHITGKIGWSAFERARLVSELINEHKKPKTWVQKYLELNQADLDAYLAAFEETARFVKSLDPQKITLKDYEVFTYFHKFYRNPFLAKKVRREPMFMSFFYDWLKNGKFESDYDISHLPTIITKKKLYDLFTTTDTTASALFKDAKKIDPMSFVPLFRLMRRLKGELLSPSEKALEEIKEHPSQALTLARQLRNSCDKFIASVEEIIDEVEKLAVLEEQNLLQAEAAMPAENS